jgi:hypothetical protein
MASDLERVVGVDPYGIRRIYASTWIEARQEARNYIRKRPDTAPLSAWRFDHFAENPCQRELGGRSLTSLGASYS